MQCLNSSVPATAPIQSGSTLYATANSGGSKNSGVLFALSLLPEITVTPQSRTAEARGTTLLKMIADGPPPFRYQWLCDGTNLTCGGWTNGLKLSDLQCDQSGTCVLVITNSFGAVTSAPMSPLPPQRFYRASQSEPVTITPSLALPGMVPAISLTGNIGDTIELDCINALGPTNAWTTLTTTTLTNTTQLYFDLSSLGSPIRLYRILSVH